MGPPRWPQDTHGPTYAGVVSRDSIRIAFTYTALNGLSVFAADISNAYLQALGSQKYYILCGPEFGIENIGKVALIRRALVLYGGKSAGKISETISNHVCVILTLFRVLLILMCG